MELGLVDPCPERIKQYKRPMHIPPPPPPPSPFGSKKYIVAPKFNQISLKWESFTVASFKFK